MARKRQTPECGEKLREANRQLVIERDFVAAVLETTPALMVVLDPQGRILRWNRACEDFTGLSHLESIGMPLWEIFPVPAPILENGLHRLLAGEPLEYESEWSDAGGQRRWLHWKSGAHRGEDGAVAYIICSGIDITLRRRAEQERERLIGELQEAIAHIKTLDGLIPICAGCKKIRDDRGYWQEVEAYIEARSEAEFSHGLCPECIRRLYPDYAGRIAARSKDGETGGRGDGEK